MSRTDDISNLFSRFGATSDSYHEFDSQFEYPNTPPAQVKESPNKPSVMRESPQHLIRAAHEPDELFRL